MKKLTIFIIFLILIFINTFSYALDGDSLVAQSAILIDTDTGKVLFEKNMDQKMFPASLTKIMTAILAIENCKLDDIVTVNYNAISSIPSGYTTANLITDEQLTVKQLLEVLLLHSANDSANVLGMHIGGSIDSFVSMMNSKAKELQCENTNFTNTYGLHDENHYSTARDLAIIARYCMKNDSFRHLVAQTSCQIPPTNKHEARTYNNTNNLIIPTSQYYYPFAIGIKTGYTKEAGNCLISASKKDGFETIAVILNTGTVHGARCTDSISLFNYAYDNFGLKKIASKGDVLNNISVFNGTKETQNLDLILSKDINVLNFLNKDIDIKPSIELKENISAPIATGSVVGTVTYDVLNTKYTADLVAAHDVQKSNFLFTILCISLALVILLIIIFIFWGLRKRKNKAFEI